MEGYRRAALALHALGDADRRWLLGQLGGADRVRLNELVVELQGLGIPPDEAFLADKRSPLGGAARPAPSNAHRATAAQMDAILSREPVPLIVAVLAIEAWPWRAAFLARLDPVRRAEVLASPLKPGGVALAAALLACIEARLEAGVDVRPEPTGIRRRLAAWTRQRARRGHEAFSTALARVASR